jgi:hypothetical protein
MGLSGVIAARPFFFSISGFGHKKGGDPPCERVPLIMCPICIKVQSEALGLDFDFVD